MHKQRGVISPQLHVVDEEWRRMKTFSSIFVVRIQTFTVGGSNYCVIIYWVWKICSSDHCSTVSSRTTSSDVMSCCVLLCPWKNSQISVHFVRKCKMVKSGYHYWDTTSVSHEESQTIQPLCFIVVCLFLFSSLNYKNDTTHHWSLLRRLIFPPCLYNWITCSCSVGCAGDLLLNLAPGYLLLCATDFLHGWCAFKCQEKVKKTPQIISSILWESI